MIERTAYCLLGADGGPSEADVAFDNLYPAIIQCFAVILCG